MSRRRASCRPPHSRLRRAALTVRLVAGGHHDDLLFCWETMYHVMVHSCGMKGNKMNIKTVGKSGQISLGKALAGMDFILEELPDGDIILKRAIVIPANERWLHEPAMQQRLARADNDRKRPRQNSSH